MNRSDRIAVITGDIIKSSKVRTEEWMISLRSALSQYGLEIKNWEIYRGDSFQLELCPGKALEAALVIKASIKQIKEIDVRMAIGIGDKEYVADKVTSSNGSAFINSGTCFEQLKKQKLAIKTGSQDFDLTMNLLFDLASLIMDEWAPTSSLIILSALKNPTFKQHDLSKLLNTSQSSISEGLKRAGYDEVEKLMEYYRIKIQALC